MCFRFLCFLASAARAGDARQHLGTFRLLQTERPGSPAEMATTLCLHGRPKTFGAVRAAGTPLLSRNFLLGALWPEGAPVGLWRVAPGPARDAAAALGSLHRLFAARPSRSGAEDGSPSRGLSGSGSLGRSQGGSGPGRLRAGESGAGPTAPRPGTAGPCAAAVLGCPLGADGQRRNSSWPSSPAPVAQISKNGGCSRGNGGGGSGIRRCI